MLRKERSVRKVLPILLLALASCASYEPVSLPHLQPEFSPYSETIDDVTLAVKPFSNADSKRYFNRDLVSKGFVPVQLTIHNNGKQYILFSTQGVNIPTVPPQDVADKVHTSTAGRVAGYGAGALILWPLLIPAIVDGVASANANEKLDRDFDAKAAQQIVVQPYARHNGVIFVPSSEYRESFDVTMVEKETKKRLHFRVRALPPVPVAKNVKSSEDI